ncbi:MAG: glycine oxidase ThiO [Planctomycetes bacterium]|nr:glycine oxidase ThiO [Planctomycetota bacterium]
MARNADVVVLGAGIVGCAIAWELAKEGRQTVVLERGSIGREASWAAGGVLTPVHLAEYPSPLATLCVESQNIFEAYLRELPAGDRAEVEYAVSGMLIPVFDERDERDVAELEAWKREHGQPVERLDAEAALAAEPALSPDLRGALLLPDVAQVRNHRLTRILAEAARRSGAEFRTGVAATGFLRVPGRINGVKTDRGDVYAGETVVAAGAWSGDLLEPLGLSVHVRPVRGQIVLLQSAPDTVRRMILSNERYLIPRADGRVLLGSTVEEAGFDTSVTAEGVSTLLHQALRFAPGLKRAAVAGLWAGLRPATPDRLPYLGRVEAIQGLILATGHFRNGILLAPLTARIVADLVAGRSPAVDLSPFRPDRVTNVSQNPS